MKFVKKPKFSYDELEYVPTMRKCFMVKPASSHKKVCFYGQKERGGRGLQVVKIEVKSRKRRNPSV